jgi:hypothetical protein
VSAFCLTCMFFNNDLAFGMDILKMLQE